jgi:hypothetical protein
LHRISADCPCDRHEFNHIKPALAAFVFGNERLGLFKPTGEVLLRETRGFAGFDHKFAENPLCRGMNRFSDAARARSHQRGKLIR